MADQITTFSTISADAIDAYIANEEYALAEKGMVVGQFARKEQLPERMGKTLKLVRHSRLNLPQTVLTEGVPPDAVALALTTVSVILEQWGIVVLMSDVALVTTKHPILNKAIELTALAMTETLEREQFMMLLGGTNVNYPSAVTTRAGLGASDKITTGLIAKALGGLRSAGAPSFGGGIYKGVMHPQVELDIALVDTTFLTAMQYGNVRVLMDAEIGRWGGVDWFRSNFTPIFVGVAAMDTAAATSTKAQYTTSTSGGSLATANYQLATVAREITTGYERKISVQTGNVAVTGATGSIAVATPTSTNYTYDIYMTEAAGTTLYRVKTGIPASSTTTITTAALTTASTPPAQVASGIEVHCSFIFGKDAFCRVELNGMSMQSFLTPDAASWSNPLNQGRKVGSKIMWKSAIIDNTFFRRLETATTNSAGLPA